MYTFAVTLESTDYVTLYKNVTTSEIFYVYIYLLVKYWRKCVQL